MRKTHDSPPRRPPLNALRAFDAAARHLSFTRAGKELFVTHGAVSRQVRQLEDHLGRQLFLREPGRLSLTRHGRQLALYTRRVFEDIDEAMRQLGRAREDRVLVLSTVPSLAARWLVPRIMGFQSRHGIELRVGTTPRLVDFDADGVDVAIRYGRGPWPGLHSEKLLESIEFPVCAPRLLQGRNAGLSLADLDRFTLLHDTTRAHWRQWLTLAGADPGLAEKGPVIEDTNVLLQAAIEGHGLALAAGPLADADVAAGRLARPLDLGLQVPAGYHVVCPPEHLRRPGMAELLDWLRSEAAGQA